MGGAGGNSPQSMSQNLSEPLVVNLRNQIVTVSFRVQQFQKHGTGTSHAYVVMNGSEVPSSVLAKGSGVYEDVRLTYKVPPDATYLEFGIKFDGTPMDAYHVCKAYLAEAQSVPQNYFSQRPGDFLPSEMDIVPESLNNAQLNFPSSLDPTGVMHSLWHDPYAETLGRVHWSITCETFATEFMSNQVGAPVGWRNVLGDPQGHDIVYGVPSYSQAIGVMAPPSHNVLQTDRGNQTNSIAPGFEIIYTSAPYGGLWVNHLSKDVQGYCLN